MSEFTTAICAEMASRGYPLPLPGEQTTEARV